MASLEAFLGLDVRIGTIVAAEPLKGAQRPALALRIYFGELGTRLGTAEITDLYEPADLVGLQVVGGREPPAAAGGGPRLRGRWCSRPTTGAASTSS